MRRPSRWSRRSRRSSATASSRPSPHRNRTARSAASCTTTCSHRRCSTGAAATRTSNDGERPNGGWRGPARARARSRLLEVRNRRLAAAVIALAAAVIGLGLYMLDPAWLQRLDLRTVDARLAVQDGHAADPRVALIAVDDATLGARAGDNGRLPRSDYG